MNNSRVIRTTVALVTAGVLATGSWGAPAAHADKKAPPKPRAGTDLHIPHYFDKASAVLLQDGATRTAEVAGTLHVTSEVTLDSDGQASEIDLHANLSDAIATVAGSDTTVRATGSFRATEPPTICALPPQLCPLPTRLTFGLSGGPGGGFEGDSLVLTVALTFDDSWHLVDVRPARGGLE